MRTTPVVKCEDQRKKVKEEQKKVQYSGDLNREEKQMDHKYSSQAQHTQIRKLSLTSTPLTTL